MHVLKAVEDVVRFLIAEDVVRELVSCAVESVEFESCLVTKYSNMKKRNTGQR